MKSNLLAVIIGTAALFGLGALIYLVIFSDQSMHMTESGIGVSKDPIDLPIIILMEVLYATLLTLISRWGKISSFGSGAKAGLITGLIIGLCFGLDLYATTTITTFSGVIFWGLTYAFRYAVAGGLIGWVLGREAGETS